MSEKLTLAKLNKLNQQYEEKKEIVVGGQYKLTIDKKFKKTKISQMMVELQTVINDLQKKNISMDEVLKIIVHIQYIFIIKYFTDFPFPKNVSVEQLLLILEKLIDTGLYEEISNSFDKKEIEILDMELQKFAKNYLKIENLIASAVANEVNSEVSENDSV